jgi:hypothetical protein
MLYHISVPNRLSFSLQSCYIFQKAGGAVGGATSNSRAHGGASSVSALNDLVDLDLNFGNPAPPLRTNASMVRFLGLFFRV